MSVNNIDELVKKYGNHPDFIGMDRSNICQPGAVGDQLIHILARKGEIGELDILIANGVNVNAVGDMQHTPLHYAAMMGRTEVVIYLLDKGANPKAKNEYDQTPLVMGDLAGYTDVVSILKEVT